jgi:hypothetical protein
MISKNTSNIYIDNYTFTDNIAKFHIHGQPSNKFGGMPAYTAGGQFHELIPIMSLLPTATPEFLKVVKNCLSFMVPTSSLSIFIIQVVLTAALIDTFELPLLRYKLFLHILWFGCFLLLLFIL